MRMWSAEPKRMCRRHLLGEHLEMHMFAGTVKRGKNIIGYVNSNLVDPSMIKIRHDLLAQELLDRGYNHHSPLDFDPAQFGLVGKPLDANKSLQDLLSRCADCRQLHGNL